ncbi:hypothetical protein ACI2L4_29110 [Streptomyces sparsogenes]|uniref:hypothetical protein n=1 Tax=Streptomyces sparsogenes TaxID=67365 RepID=UPI0033F73108
MSDYFDRLLARHAPARTAAAGGAGDRPARVRPRLPGPYERIESLRAGPTLPEEPAPLFAAPPRPAPWRGESVRHEREREVETVRDTVIRTEAAPHADPGRPTAAPPTAPLLRPAALITPGRRPDGFDAPRPGRREAPPADPGQAPRDRVPPPVPRDTLLTPPAVAEPPRPRPTGAALDREAVRGAVGRRRSRPAERVVHVQIGRLEVSAAGAGASDAGRQAGARPEHTGRRAPALSLQDYLARGETRS